MREVENLQPANDTAEPFGIGADTWPGLAKLAEEASEVIQIIAKLIATGGRTDHWSGMDLGKALEDELGDLEAPTLVPTKRTFGKASISKVRATQPNRNTQSSRTGSDPTLSDALMNQPTKGTE
jgi:hypothetical protein